MHILCVLCVCVVLRGKAHDGVTSQFHCADEYELLRTVRRWDFTDLLWDVSLSSQWQRDCDCELKQRTKCCVRFASEWWRCLLKD